MLLAFNIGDIVTVPFGLLLTLLYRLTTNYGVALTLFAILVKVVLLPATAKSKKSSMKMSRLTPRVEEIKRKYPDDQAKQSQAMQELYKSEGVSMFGGCLWSLVPLLILIPLYSVIRHPIEYMLRETAENATAIVNAIAAAAPELLNPMDYYAEMTAARYIPDFAAAIREVLPDVSEATLAGVNFNFLGVDLGSVPQLGSLLQKGGFTWANVGLVLIPILSAGSQMLSMVISNKLNQSLVTDKNGVHDADAAKSSQQQQTGKVMMWIMPIMSLWIGFTVCAALSLYWLVQGIVTAVADIIMTNHYRKIYDAEDAERLRKAMEAEAIEAEKERLRAERRAANPDGITTNTSKKKLQQKQKAEEQAAKAAAAKEYAAKKGLRVEEEAPAEEPAAGKTDRPYGRGRAFDPNRYRDTDTEE